MLCPRARCVTLALTLVIATDVDAQTAGSTPSHAASLGSPGEDRARLELLLGRHPPGTGLIRSASSLVLDTAKLSWTRPRLEWRAPELDVTSNSAIPFSLNDGPQWSGRGYTYSASAGFHGALGRIRVILRPLYWRAQNLPFGILPGGDPTRSAFASPYHVGSLSADLPVRFGMDPLQALDLGESTLWVTMHGFSAGLSSEAQWWGPALRNAIVMSNNAGGFPHAFLRTAVPAVTGVGQFEARWVIGALTESRFFDRDPTNNLRSSSGIVATFTPRTARDLTVGVSRVVYENIGGAAALPARAFDALFRWGGGFNVRDAREGRAAEQLTGVFGRWVFPSSRAEIYGEWVRILLPVSVRDLLVAPQFTQGFTVGMQWLPLATAEWKLRVHTELTNLEQSPNTRAADTIAYYSSGVVPQGYTHRGQVIGAAIGPGGSSQWLAADVITDTHMIGAFAGRIRWDTDTYYTQPTSLAHFAYDVTMLSGVRASTRVLGRGVAVELSIQRRYNFLFQNSLFGYSRDTAFDKENVFMRFRILP